MEDLVMSLELYEAAVKGDVSIFLGQHGTGQGATAGTSSNTADKFFLTCTLEERNTIIHVAARYGQDDSKYCNFIEHALQRFPSLIGQTNSKDDTALHVSARQGNREISKLLVASYRDIDGAAAAPSGGEPLWRMKNAEGDTPLHVALKRDKVQVALFLISLDNSLADSLNNFGETPLHLAVKTGSGVGASKNGMIEPSSTQGGNLRQDLQRLIYLSLRKPSTAGSIRDMDGLTPLLRASGRRNGVPVISVLLGENPQLVEQRDLGGRTVLHLMKLITYEEGKRALAIPGIDSLKDEQDFNGDTPVHLAIKYSEFVKIRTLAECSADFTIRNSSGISSWDLIQLQDNFSRKLKEEIDSVMNGKMKKETYKAAVKGDVRFLGQHDDINLLYRSADGNNILHIAMSPEATEGSEFVKNVTERFPILLCQTNDNGDTPLHLAARVRTLAAQKLLISCRETFQKASGKDSLCLDGPPWRKKNSEGNTPLHEALRAGSDLCARFLIRIDKEVAWHVNNCNETPLHVCARYKQPSGPLFARITWPYESSSTNISELDLLLEANISASFLRDVNGLTPLMIAAKSNQVEKVAKIVNCCPRSAELRDFDGRTILHFIPLNDTTESLLEIPQLQSLTMVQDYGGNTALHIAIKNRQFSKVKVLVKHSLEAGLEIENNDGEVPISLIRSQTEVPHEIRQLVEKRCPMPRSLYGISEAAMKENVNILLVVAVLLATITFAAGFTVPGGFDGQTGNPIVIKQAAFKVFVIADTYAMCCSMLALFSLIWVMTGKTLESVKLIDLSIFVLQQAFYGTTLAFMTGVYVALSSKALWTAILVCGLCSCLIICSLKPVNVFLSRIFPLIKPGLAYSVASECAWLSCIPCMFLAWISGCCNCWERRPNRPSV